MSREQNLEIASTLLDGMGTGRDPHEIAALFAEDLVFEIQVMPGCCPGSARRTGRDAMADFMRDQRAMTEPLAFDVEDVLASEERDGDRREAAGTDQGDRQDHRDPVRAGADDRGQHRDALPDAGGQPRRVPSCTCLTRHHEPTIAQSATWSLGPGRRADFPFVHPLRESQKRRRGAAEVCVGLRKARVSVMVQAVFGVQFRFALRRGVGEGCESFRMTAVMATLGGLPAATSL